MPNFFPGSSRDRQWRKATIAQDIGQWDTPLPSLFGQDLAIVQQAYGLPPVDFRARRLPDYTWEYSAPSQTGLFAQDLVLPAQSLGLPPAYLRATTNRLRDYTWEYSQPSQTNLFGQDLILAAQSLGLPPGYTAPAQRRGCVSFDPGTNFLLLLVSVAAPAGAQSTDNLPPRGPARQRDYTWLQSGPPNYLAGEVAPMGAQQTALPPRSAPRCADFSTPANFTVELDFAAQQVPPQGQTTALTDNLAPRAPKRSADYTWLQSGPPVYLAGEVAPMGVQSTTLPPRPYARAESLVDVGFNFLASLTSVPGPAGIQSIDLPPRTSARGKDYSWLHQTDRQLIGQDAMVTGASTLDTELPARAYARARDYTWLQSLPLYVYQQLPVGDSTLLTEGPPKGPQRLKDYTYLHLTDTQLIGQDAMAVGQPWLDTDNLWPKPAQRARDYTLILRFDLPNLAATTHPGQHTLSDRELFHQGLSDESLYVHTVSDSVGLR